MDVEQFIEQELKRQQIFRIYKRIITEKEEQPPKRQRAKAEIRSYVEDELQIGPEYALSKYFEVVCGRLNARYILFYPKRVGGKYKVYEPSDKSVSLSHWENRNPSYYNSLLKLLTNENPPINPLNTLLASYWYDEMNEIKQRLEDPLEIRYTRDSNRIKQLPKGLASDTMLFFYILILPTPLDDDENIQARYVNLAFYAYYFSHQQYLDFVQTFET